MTTVTLNDILCITEGVNIGCYIDLDTEIDAIATDSKRMYNGSPMFVCYAGRNADGHDFVEEAFSNGCIGCLIEKPLKNYRSDVFYVLVENTLDALWKIAVFKLRMTRTKLICVTGSVGKTTTTGMIASVLSMKYEVFRTEENFNDEFLAPVMIFRISDRYDLAVIELGLGEHSSVRKMAELIKPMAVVITRVGYAHVGITGSLENTCKEKCGVENGLSPIGTVFANCDDELIRKYPFRHDVQWFGLSDANKIGIDIESHLKYAAAAAMKVGKYCGIGMQEIAEGIRKYSPDPGRMDIEDYRSFTLIDSSFNASLESVRLALDKLAECDGTRIAVLGEMLELGDYAAELHEKVGAMATPEKVDIVITVGHYGEATVKRLHPDVEYACVDTPGAAEILVLQLLLLGKKCAFLVKGSHGSGVWKVAEYLKERGKRNGKKN